MPTSFHIRPAIPADMPGVGAMQHACWMHAYKGLLDDAFLAQLTPEGIAGYHAKHFDAAGNHAAPGMPFFVAELLPREHPRETPRRETTIRETPARTNPILGMVRGGPTRAKSASGDTVPPEVVTRYPFELFGIHVAHDLHRSGIGRALFSEYARAARALGHSSLVLWVLSDNAPAIAFYKSLGGTPVANSPLTLGTKQYPQTAYAWSDLRAFSK
ncbi:MAG: GNAT family N-acetyltransferase [Phycisphaeraceae bacterium]|nr:GNAT family N-acetyltransferase [Phycisphaeraceae bacterium]